jgi:chromosome segregation ATPase
MLKNSSTIAELQTKVGELELKAAAAAELQTKLDETGVKMTALEGEKVELSGKVTTLEGEKTELNGKITVLTGTVATHAATIAANDVKITKLEGEAKSSDVKAREIAARFGVNLPEKDVKAGDFTKSGNATSMARADFIVLSASAKSAFCKAGGKLTD